MHSLRIVPSTICIDSYVPIHRALLKGFNDLEAASLMPSWSQGFNYQLVMMHAWRVSYLSVELHVYPFTTGN